LTIQKIDGFDEALGVKKELRSIDGWLQWVLQPTAKDLECGLVQLPEEVKLLVAIGKKAKLAGFDAEESDSFSESFRKKAKLGDSIASEASGSQLKRSTTSKDGLGL
jgi:hypothetical protein